MLKYNCRIIVAILSSIMISGCSNHAPAPVVDLNLKTHSTSAKNKVQTQTHHSSSEFKVHEVKAGETLFSIAWRYSLDHNELAKINNIKNNKIYPQQQLNLINTQPSANDLAVFNVQSLMTALNNEILNKKHRPPLTPSNKGKPTKNNLRKSTISKKNITKRTDKSKQIKKTNTSGLMKRNNSVKRWIWPVNGKVVNYFSKKHNQNKGLDIVAKKGSAVRAAAPGKVVYSGSGLRGYGRLVIIKHNDAFLSAYAHNEKIHVEENEFVKAGQRIADLGNSGSSIDKLHFEIRYKGKPVDPLNYLPKSEP